MTVREEIGGEMDGRCVPASAEKVRAFWIGDGILISAQGTLPTPCWDVKIDQSPLDIWPPEFALRRCSTDLICPQHVVPYSASEYFPMGSRPDQIVIHDADGRRTFDVEDIPTDTLMTPGAADPGMDEAVGLSGDMSFDGAFRDALQKLPPWDAVTPDEMAVITVTETGAWLGGIAGFHPLFVKVRGARRRQT
jgi:hypothetical protein